MVLASPRLLIAATLLLLPVSAQAWDVIDIEQRSPLLWYSEYLTVRGPVLSVHVDAGPEQLTASFNERGPVVLVVEKEDPKLRTVLDWTYSDDGRTVEIEAHETFYGRYVNQEVTRQYMTQFDPLGRPVTVTFAEGTSIRRETRIQYADSTATSTTNEQATKDYGAKTRAEYTLDPDGHVIEATMYALPDECLVERFAQTLVTNTDGTVTRTRIEGSAHEHCSCCDLSRETTVFSAEGLLASRVLEIWEDPGAPYDADYAVFVTENPPSDVRRMTRTYEFDARGNWVVMRETTDHAGRDGVIHPSEPRTVTRTITYWDS